MRGKRKRALTRAISVESVCSDWYSSNLMNLCHYQRTGGQSTLNGRKERRRERSKRIPVDYVSLENAQTNYKTTQPTQNS